MKKYGNGPTQFAELNELLGQMVMEVRRILGEHFVGAYLQGSFALCDADMYSDCDFLVVTRRALTPAQEEGLRELHADIRTRPGFWVHHLEGSYAPQDELRSLSGLGKKWLFIDQGHSGSEMEWSTHCNTEVVRWILREHGVTLAGPNPKDLVHEVDPNVLRAAMRKEAEEFLPGMLTWIKLDSPWAQRYAVTSLCRILYTLETGQVASKRVSLLWAKDTLDSQWQELISETLEGRSLGWNHWDPVKPGALEATLAFNEYATRRAARR
jgi:predicted nucleotidyltransferase